MDITIKCEQEALTVGKPERDTALMSIRPSGDQQEVVDQALSYEDIQSTMIKACLGIGMRVPYAVRIAVVNEYPLLLNCGFDSSWRPRGFIVSLLRPVIG